MSGPNRSATKLFSEGMVRSLPTSNRLIRSATWDPAMVFSRQVDNATLVTYRRLAQGGVGIIIVGDFDVLPKSFADASDTKEEATYGDVRINGFQLLADAIHQASLSCKVIAQVSASVPGYAVSPIRSPLTGRTPYPLTSTQIQDMARFFAVAIEGVRDDGFDGAQIHAAHGGLLSRFLSPYSNRRTDEYGGDAEGRTRLIREIIKTSRERVGDFPLLIKLNGTDYLDSGISLKILREQTALIAEAGIDAIEISGGMWECLLRPEGELGFPPVPAPESHTRISNREQQGYFLPYAEAIDVDVPVILGGGNRDAEHLEAILNAGAVDFVSLSRPLIREPDLPQRWFQGRGPSTATCISCNACVYDMHRGIRQGVPGHTRCMVDCEPESLEAASHWLTHWANERKAAMKEHGTSHEE